jgi:hypothetical protein
MSAASQAREQARIQKLLLKRYPDIPEPHEPPTPLDAELERLLAWFIQNRREIAKVNSCAKVVVHDDGYKPEFWKRR